MIHFKQRDAGAWHQAILYIKFIKMYQMLTKSIVKQKTHHQAVTLFFTLVISEVAHRGKNVR